MNFIFSDSKIKKSDEVKKGIIVDYDNGGKIVSIEILDASKHTKKPLEVSYEILKA